MTKYDIIIVYNLCILFVYILNLSENLKIILYHQTRLLKEKFH